MAKAKKKALIFWGGWDGHTPKETAGVLADGLKDEGFSVRVVDNQKALQSEAALKKLDLIVPMWTMGALEGKAWPNINAAVRSGVGIAGVHGGAGDAFRGNVNYQWMIGGQFTGHPHVGKYAVKLTGKRSPITRGMPKSFRYESEQYYMLIDPAIDVLATTVYTKYEGKRCEMPVVWTKSWGKGKVFYSALGHRFEEFEKYPHVFEMTIRGFKWAAK